MVITTSSGALLQGKADGDRAVGEIQQICSISTVHPVTVAEAAPEDVITAKSAQCVSAAAANEDIIGSVTDERIVAAASYDAFHVWVGICSLYSWRATSVGSKRKTEVTGCCRVIKQIYASATVQNVIVRPSLQCVITVSTIQCIITTSTNENISGTAARQCVSTTYTIDIRTLITLVRYIKQIGSGVGYINYLDGHRTGWG